MSKEKVVRKTLEDVVGASRDDIEDVMWGDSFRDGLGSKNDGRKNERTLESLLAYHMTHKPTKATCNKPRHSPTDDSGSAKPCLP